MDVKQTAYSIIINITCYDIHFTLFYNIYTDSDRMRSCSKSDESSAFHISAKNISTSKI